LKKRAKAEEARLESHDGKYMLFSRRERYHWSCSNPNKQRQGYLSWFLEWNGPQ
jgi:hypothetical protein